VIKAFNNILAKSLLEKGVRGNDGGIALSVAGDSFDAKATVLRLIDDLGFDPWTVVIWTTPGGSSPERRLTAGIRSRALRRALAEADRSRSPLPRRTGSAYQKGYCQPPRRVRQALSEVVAVVAHCGTGDLTTHGFRANFGASLLRRLGAGLRRQCGGDDRLVRVHVAIGEMPMPGGWTWLNTRNERRVLGCNKRIRNLKISRQ